MKAALPMGLPHTWPSTAGTPVTSCWHLMPPRFAQLAASAFILLCLLSAQLSVSALLPGPALLPGTALPAASALPAVSALLIVSALLADPSGVLDLNHCMLAYVQHIWMSHQVCQIASILKPCCMPVHGGSGCGLPHPLCCEESSDMLLHMLCVGFIDTSFEQARLGITGVAVLGLPLC